MHQFFILTSLVPALFLPYIHNTLHMHVTCVLIYGKIQCTCDIHCCRYMMYMYARVTSCCMCVYFVCSFDWRTSREPNVTDERSLQPKQLRLQQEGTMRRPWDWNASLHTLPCGFRRSTTQSPTAWCTCTGVATGKANTVAIGGWSFQTFSSNSIINFVDVYREFSFTLLNPRHTRNQLFVFFDIIIGIYTVMNTLSKSVNTGSCSTC